MEDYISMAMIAIYTTLLLIPMIYNTLQYNKGLKRTTYEKNEQKLSSKELKGKYSKKNSSVKVLILMNDFDEKQLNQFLSLIASKTYMKKDEVRED